MTSNEPEPRQEELDDLQRDIDEIRAEVDEPPETEQRRFHERGTEGPVDDTIVPPG